MRKNSTKRTKAIDLSNASLGQLLSAVLKHPDLPPEIYDDIGDNLCDLENEYCRVDHETPEYIDWVLWKARRARGR